MATSKLLKPTNVTISIPEFTDQPDQRVNSNGLDKEADAINALSEHLANIDGIDASSFTAGAKYTIESSRIQILGVYAFATLHAVANQSASSSDVIATAPANYRPTSNATSIMCFYKTANGDAFQYWASYSTLNTSGDVKQGAVSSVPSGTEFFITFAYRIKSINS